MVQNYPRDAAYTPRVIMKLELCDVVGLVGPRSGR
jgi:hypothetical protein